MYCFLPAKFSLGFENSASELHEIIIRDVNVMDYDFWQAVSVLLDQFISEAGEDVILWMVDVIQCCIDFVDYWYILQLEQLRRDGSHIGRDFLLILFDPKSLHHYSFYFAKLGKKFSYKAEFNI